MTSSEIIVTQKEKTLIDDLLPSINGKNSNSRNYIDDLSSKNFDLKSLKSEKGEIVEFFTEHNVVLIQFCLEGECFCTSETVKNPFLFGHTTYNILYIPKGEVYITPISEEVQLLNIFLEEAFFFRQMPENHSAFNNKRNNTFGAVFKKNHYINAKIEHILNEITTCEFDGHLKTLYLKAKMIELIGLQLAQAKEQKVVELKPAEIDKMREVKELIANNLNESYSLSYLARVAGTNEQYLKKHFKLLYGNTVFGYINSCKMQKAKELLLTGNHQITEIAKVVGYRHATHFTSAFKKFFGFVPKMIKTKFLFGSYLSLNFELELLEVIIAI